uniref:Uncharacterized protein n=1 Tax=Hyaloperonospora arabidopsidis (strain Emoy2) TaxID=559515 RepID=M4BC16_HYAAE
MPKIVNPERRLSAYALYDIGVLLPKLHHLLLAGLVCLARLFGHHGGHFAGGTWNRISSPGCRQGAEVAGNAGYQTDHPDGPLTHLDLADLNHVLGKFASRGSGVKLGDPADNLRLK